MGFHFNTNTWTQIKKNIQLFISRIQERDTLIRENQEKHREIQRLKLEYSLEAHRRLVRLMFDI